MRAGPPAPGPASPRPQLAPACHGGLSRLCAGGGTDGHPGPKQLALAGSARLLRRGKAICVFAGEYR